MRTSKFFWLFVVMVVVVVELCERNVEKLRSAAVWSRLVKTTTEKLVQSVDEIATAEFVSVGQAVNGDFSVSLSQRVRPSSVSMLEIPPI